LDEIRKAADSFVMTSNVALKQQFKSNVFNVKWKLTNINIINQEPTNYRLVKLKNENDKLFRLEYKGICPQIGDFNSGREFIVKIILLKGDVIQVYRPQIGLMKESFDKDFPRWERSDNTGLGSPSDYKNTVKDYNVLVNEISQNNGDGGFFKSESGVDSNGEAKIKKNSFSFTDKQTLELLKLCEKYDDLMVYQSETKNNITKWRRLVDMCLSSYNYKLDKLPQKPVKEKYLIWPFPTLKHDVFDKVVRKSPTVNKYVLSFMDNYFSKRLAVEVADPILTTSFIFRQINVRLNELSHINYDLSQTTKSSPLEFLTTLCYHLTTSSYTYISWKPSGEETFNIVEFLTCILLRVLVPFTARKRDDILLCDNYICRHLVGNMLNINMDSVEYNSCEKNYLYEFYKKTFVKKIFGTFLQSSSSDMFLESFSMGVHYNKSYKTQYSDITGVTKIIYPYAVPITYDMKTTDAISRINSLASSLNSNCKVFNNTFRSSILDRIINLLRLSICNMKNFQVVISQAVRKGSMIPFFNQISYSEWDDTKDKILGNVNELARISIDMSSSAILSGLLYGNYSYEHEIASITPEDIISCVHFKNLLNNIGQNIQIAYDELKITGTKFDFGETENEFKPSEKVEFAFNMPLDYEISGGLGSSFLKELKNEILLYKNFGLLKDFKMSYKDNIRLAIRDNIGDYIMKNPHLFGFINEFAYSRQITPFLNNQNCVVLYYDPNSQIKNQDTIIKNAKFGTTGILSVPESGHIKLSYKQMISDLSDGTLAKKIMENIFLNKSIIFEIPIKFKSKQYFYNPKAIDVLPIVSHESCVFSLSHLTIYYEDLNDYRFINYLNPEIVQMPQILPVYSETTRHCIMPDEKPIDLLKSCMTMQNRYYYNLFIYSDEDIFKFKSLKM